jgi:hypothetical protein
MARLVALLLAVGLAGSGASCTGCATALLEGVLVADGNGGLGVRAGGGRTVRVDWPDGVGIGRDGGELVLTNPLGQPIAHQGEHVSMGGGQVGDADTFGACGPVAVSASGPPPR